MKYEHLTSTQQLKDFLQRFASSPRVAFDTEFVSEDTYAPELCLIQLAVSGAVAVIDPQTVDDLLPFWQFVTAEDRQTVVHAGREEYRFCRAALGDRPPTWFDTQLAAGLIGLEYPAAYSTLVNKLLGHSLSKGETRTNWRRRPLTPRQIEYALQDVVHLDDLCNKLTSRLTRLGRLPWLESETLAWQAKIDASERSEPWRRVSGISGLKPRMLAVVRELWTWRDGEARSKNRPPRRILRDDLIVELARRGSADSSRIRAIRGMEYRHLQRHLKDLGDCIQRALDLSDEECPRPLRRPPKSQLQLLGQFLSTALGSICREAQVAPSLAGTSQDVQDLIAYHLKMGRAFDEPPSLACGWRAEVVGRMIDDLLDGKLGIWIEDPRADQPLRFERRDD